MPTFIVKLRPDPTCNVPNVVALRRLLKALGRVYGLRAIEVTEHSADPSDAPAAQQTHAAPIVDGGIGGSGHFRARSEDRRCNQTPLFTS